MNHSRLVIENDGDVGVQGSITASSFQSLSDTRIKANQQQVPYDDCKHIFNNVEVKKYTRTATEQQRVGFIAHDLDAVCKEDIACIVGKLKSADMPTEEVIDEEPLLTVDYSRLVTVLWGVCTNLQGRVAQLEQAASSSRINTSSA